MKKYLNIGLSAVLCVSLLMFSGCTGGYLRYGVNGETKYLLGSSSTASKEETSDTEGETSEQSEDTDEVNPADYWFTTDDGMIYSVPVGESNGRYVFFVDDVKNALQFCKDNDVPVYFTSDEEGQEQKDLITNLCGENQAKAYVITTIAGSGVHIAFDLDTMKIKKLKTIQLGDITKYDTAIMVEGDYEDVYTN